MENHATWIRVAGNAANIKAGHPHGWRCFIEGNTQEFPLKNWILDGVANSKNVIPGFSAQKDHHGLVAWIDCFGSYVIENEILHIHLS